MFGLNPYVIGGALLGGMLLLGASFTTGMNFAYKTYKVETLSARIKVLERDIFLAKAAESDATDKKKELEDAAAADDKRIGELELELRGKDKCLADDDDIGILRRGRSR